MEKQVMMKIVKHQYLNGCYQDETKEIVFTGTMCECQSKLKEIYDSFDENDESVVSKSGIESDRCKLSDVGVTWVDEDVIGRRTIVTDKWVIDTI